MAYSQPDIGVSEGTQMAVTRRQITRWLAGLVAIALAITVGWWAARATFASNTPSGPAKTEQVYAAAQEASVGRTYNFNVTVKQPLTLVAANSLSGVVTYVSGGGQVKPGDTVYSVANQPVRVATGAMPFYRSLAEGAKGTDVKQVQQLLADLGYAVGVDGEWGPRTTSALKKWQKDTDQPETGAIKLGELVAVPNLPSAVTIGEKIKLGHVVSSGEDGVLARFGEPEFVLSLSSDQTPLVPIDAAVSVIFADLTWPAVISETRPADSKHGGAGGMEYVLTAPGGGLVCAADCARLPADEKVSLRSRVQAVPQVSGVGIPAAAVHTDTVGATYVTMSDGNKHAVKVLASGDGIAVVAGLKVGDQVLMPVGSKPVPNQPGTPGTPGAPPGSPAGSPPASTAPASGPTPNQGTDNKPSNEAKPSEKG